MKRNKMTKEDRKVLIEGTLSFAAITIKAILIIGLIFSVLLLLYSNCAGVPIPKMSLNEIGIVVLDTFIVTTLYIFSNYGKSKTKPSMEQLEIKAQGTCYVDKNGNLIFEKYTKEENKE